MIKRALAALLLIRFLMPSSPALAYELETVASGLKNPWAVEFLPNGDALVTERAGSIAVIRNGARLAQDVGNVPSVYFAGQGGLLDIMLDRDFTTNRQVYLSFAAGNRSENAATLVAAILKANGEAASPSYSLTNIKTLFVAKPLKNTAHHYGARIAQLQDDSLVMTVGDGFNFREKAQTLDNHFGKTIRINKDGSVPDDNPYVDTPDALPEIYSIGHRNQQALSVVGNRLYQNEHGPQGGDEVNLIIAGDNYGWPIATNGIDYNGARISPFTDYPGMRDPLIDWTPSIAPSSMAFHQGSLYVTTLAEGSIRKITIEGEQLADKGIVFDQLNERLRDVVSAPDGHLYVLTDGGDARLIRIRQSRR